VHTDRETSLTGRAAHRIENVLAALKSAIRNRTTDLAQHELDAWHRAIVDADRDGCFFFVETAILVVAVKP
jgi:hypothetical protein